MSPEEKRPEFIKDDRDAMEKEKKHRGGKRIGAGAKPGTRNAVKPKEQQKTVEKYIGFTEDEWELVEKKLTYESRKKGRNSRKRKFAKYGHDLIMKDVKQRLKYTARNSEFLRRVRHWFNSKIYAHALHLMNKQGEQAAIDFVKQYGEIPTDPSQKELKWC